MVKLSSNNLTGLKFLKPKFWVLMYFPPNTHHPIKILWSFSQFKEVDQNLRQHFRLRQGCEEISRDRNAWKSNRAIGRNHLFCKEKHLGFEIYNGAFFLSLTNPLSLSLYFSISLKIRPKFLKLLLSQICLSLKSVGLSQLNGNCQVLLSMSFGVLDLRCSGVWVMAGFWSQWVLMFGC